MNLFENGASTSRTASLDLQRNKRMLFNLLWSLTLASFLSCFLTSTLSAQIAKPSEVEKEIPNAVLSGSGELTVLWMSIYDSSLWVQSKPWSFTQKFSLTIDYKRDISREDLVDSSIDEMKRYYRFVAKEQAYRAKYKSIFPNIKKGDRISAIYKPREGLYFYHTPAGTDSPRLTGTIKDMEFAKRFIMIWLHPNAHYNDLRNKLLYGR